MIGIIQFKHWFEATRHRWLYLRQSVHLIHVFVPISVLPVDIRWTDLSGFWDAFGSSPAFFVS